jgi:hypothetical protein
VGIFVCGFVGVMAFLFGLLFKSYRKYEAAQKCMEFGRICALLSCSLFALMFILVGNAWPGVIILAAIGSGLMMRKSKFNTCPCCDEFIGIGVQYTHFTKWMFFRRSSNCPNCETRLIRSKWPWRIANISLVFIVICVLLILFKVIFERGLYIMAFLSGVLLLAVTFTSKFEILDEY